MQPQKETKESRARRGKVGHLRCAPPSQHLTLCSVDPDSSGVKVVSREVFDNMAAAGMACRNCLRGLRVALNAAEPPRVIQRSGAPEP